MQLLKKLFGHKTLSRGIVGISLLPEGIAIALAEYGEANSVKLKHCEFIPTSEQDQTLKSLVNEHKLTEFDCHLLLTSEHYRIVNIEAPVVPDNEMKEAIRWKLNDLIDFPADQAEIDFFGLPPSKNVSAAKMLSAVASDDAVLRTLIEPFLASELDINVINIQEMALRNLAVLLPENDRGIALLHLQKHSGMIVIQKDGIIYLSRKLNTGFEQLELSSDEGESDSSPSSHLYNLGLEIQRSLDYVESFYGLPPISGIAVIPMDRNTHELLNFLNSNQGLTARIMDISTILELDFLLNDSTQSQCAPVIGATLRQELSAS